MRFLGGRIFLGAILLGSATLARAVFDPANLDPTVPPSEDFYRYANGGWLRNNPVPPSETEWGPFNLMNERNESILRRILEQAAAAPGASGAQKLVGDFFASGMDEAAIERAGLAPVAADLARLDRVATVADVRAAIGFLHRSGIDAGFGVGSEQDPKDSAHMIAGVGQGGLGLPDRDYYLRTDPASADLRTAYAAHVAKLLQLAGAPPRRAQQDAAAVLRLETALARASKSSVDLRDPQANFHPLALAEVARLTPHFNWDDYFRALGFPVPPLLDVGQPEFLRGWDRALGEFSLPDWRAYLRWHFLHGIAPYLPAAFSRENFAFYGTTLQGVTVQRERWKRVLNTVDGNVGEALGQLYVQDNFPPAAKARVRAMIERLRAALAVQIRQLTWMDEPTKQVAAEKLAALGVKVGYPDKWIDYSALAIDRTSYVRNVLRAQEFAVRRSLARVGRPVDRAEWSLTPPSVNAYYSPALNEIVFPAGILQPPFFDPEGDDAANFGAIGAVIGHETTHGFDDEGRQFDAQGNLRDWWSPASDRAFAGRAAGMARQFSAYRVAPDLPVNGQLTLGENIADLGGVKIAFHAWLAAHPEDRDRDEDGFTGAQRFFLSFASVWRENQRPEAERLQVNTDPHAPARFRVNGPLSNLPEFAAAFLVPEGAPMRRAAADRVEIW